MTKEGSLECDRHVALDNQGLYATLGNAAEILVKRGGNMRCHRIRVVPGDRVRASRAPCDLTRGRIVFRYPEPLQTGSA
jgi:translation initiation factor IF-1